MSPAFSRIAFCMYMLKFVGTSKTKKNTFYLIIITQLIVNLGTMVEVLISCEDFAQLWDHNLTGRCWSPRIQAYTGFFQGGMLAYLADELVSDRHAAWNSMTDIVLTVLPILILMKLNMELRTRVALCVILGLSFFAGVACIVKTIELRALGDRLDFTYSTANFVIWFTVEQYIVIIAASIPTIRPLALRLSQRWKNRTPTGSLPTANRPIVSPPTAIHPDGSADLTWSSVTQPRPVRLNTPVVDDGVQKVELEPPYVHPSPRSPPPPGTIRKTISIVIKSESMDENLNQARGVHTTVSAGPTTPEPATAAVKHESWPFPGDGEDK